MRLDPEPLRDFPETPFFHACIKVAVARTTPHAPHRGVTPGVITVALSATIGATRERVWQALTLLGERTSWDERLLGEIAIDTGPLRSDRSRSHRTSAPSTVSLQTVSLQGVPRSIRWRFRLNGVQLVMHEHIREIEPPGRLVSRISIGSLRFDQTFTLHSDHHSDDQRDDDHYDAKTRLGLRIAASNSIAVVGEIVPRLDVQKLVIGFADTTLRQIQKHCEADA
jgi:hypothetical protein